LIAYNVKPLAPGFLGVFASRSAQNTQKGWC